MEGHVVAELEHPDGAVFIGGPGLGQHGLDLTGLRIVMGQCLIYILQDHDAV